MACRRYCLRRRRCPCPRPSLHLAQRPSQPRQRAARAACSGCSPWRSTHRSRRPRRCTRHPTRSRLPWQGAALRPERSAQSLWRRAARLPLGFQRGPSPSGAAGCADGDRKRCCSRWARHRGSAGASPRAVRCGGRDRVLRRCGQHLAHRSFSSSSSRDHAGLRSRSCCAGGYSCRRRRRRRRRPCTRCRRRRRRRCRRRRRRCHSLLLRRRRPSRSFFRRPSRSFGPPLLRRRHRCSRTWSSGAKQRGCGSKETDCLPFPLSLLVCCAPPLSELASWRGRGAGFPPAAKARGFPRLHLSAPSFPTHTRSDKNPTHHPARTVNKHPFLLKLRSAA